MLCRDSKIRDSYYIFAPSKRESCFMKQCIKYSILIILIALLHNSAIKAAGFLCTPVSNNTEYCFSSQTSTSKQAVQDFYSHFSIVSLCVEHVDSAQVPASKSIMLLTRLFGILPCTSSSGCDRLLYLPSHPVPDTSYYIFGLRKIII